MTYSSLDSEVVLYWNGDPVARQGDRSFERVATQPHVRFNLHAATRGGISDFEIDHAMNKSCALIMKSNLASNADGTTGD